MKQGKDIVELAQEVSRRAAAKLDFIADTRDVTATVTKDGESSQCNLVLKSRDLTDASPRRKFAIAETAHDQLQSNLEIPAKYYDRMRSEAPQLWSTNVNHWLQENGSRRMIRTLDGRARAFLSDRYRRLDNEDVCEAALPILLESDDIQIVSCDMTDHRLYLKAVFPRITKDVRVGDTVQAGVAIGNSEIGQGSLYVKPFIMRLICLNGMVSEDATWKAYHIGAIGDDIDGLALRDETQRACDKALMLTLQDAIRAASGAAFDRIIERMREATEGPKIIKPVPAIEVLARTIGLTKGEGESVLERLIRDHDYSRYGVANAVTNLANDVDSYDRASELEVIGGRVLDLAANDWRRIAEAA